MAAAHKYPNLLASYKHGDLNLKHRIAMAPMTRARGEKDLLPNTLMAEYYSQRASGGLLISEGVHISPRARGWIQVPGIWTQEQVEAWKPVTKAVHEKGAAFFVQLWHQGRQSHSSFHGGKLPVSASNVPLTNPVYTQDFDKQPPEIPHALTKDEIKDTIQDFVISAKNSIEAGFDGVEIHAANGYLVDQFLQSKTNQRTDEYGGSVENRFLFLKELLAAVSEAIGEEKTAVRLSPNTNFNEMGSPDFREQFTYVIHEIGKLFPNLAFLHVVDGIAFGTHGLGAPMTLREVRDLLPASMTLIGNCGYTAETAEEAIARGDADIISFGRAYLSNPDFVERVRAGHPLAEPVTHEWWFTPNDDYPSGKGYVDQPTFDKAQPQPQPEAVR